MTSGRCAVPNNSTQRASRRANGLQDKRHSCVSFRVLWFVGLAILAVTLFGGAHISAQTTNRSLAPGRVRDLSEETRYWKEFHKKRDREKLVENQRRQRERAEVQQTVSGLVQAGELAAPAELAAEIPHPVEHSPSIFEGKSEYVLFGFTFLLVAVLFTSTLVRHKRDAEIRALTGKYLVDGAEIARFKLPALFDLPPPSPEMEFGSDDFVDSLTEDAGPTKPAYPARVAEFFDLAPDRLEEMRKLLSDFGKAFDDEERHQVLVKLHELVGLLRSKADFWDLRPVWQMSSALELLMKRLVDKGKEATPSTIRTVASALDMLKDLCVPGVRPDLIINPPISVLAVDDDPLCLRAVVFALQKASMAPDVADNGEKAVALAAEKPYDVIFMDIQMPGIDGMEACSQIHKTKRNLTTPVVFVTVRSDFHTRAQSTLRGGSDLMAKPFLMFEITVKALMLTMRKRLQLAASCEREVSPFAPPARSARPAVEPEPGKPSAADTPNSNKVADANESVEPKKGEPVQTAETPAPAEIKLPVSGEAAIDFQKPLPPLNSRKMKRQRELAALHSARMKEDLGSAKP